MGDDICRPHQHFAKGADSYVCHHFYPTGGEWRCPYCGSKRQSVISRDAGRKHRDKLDR